MNILLCVTGFFVCFLSLGMNNEYKKDSHITENGQSGTLEDQESNDDSILQSFTSFCMDNEYKKDSHITENSQSGTLEDQESNNEDISQIVNFMNEQNFIDAQNLLEQFLEYDPRCVNEVFTKDNKDYMFFSYFLFICTNNIRDVIKDEDWDAAELMEALVRASAKAGQMDEEKCVGHCYIRKNDSRIIDAMVSAMNNKYFCLAHLLVKGCFESKYLDFNVVFEYKNKLYTPFSYYVDCLKGLSIDEYDDTADLGSVLLALSEKQADVEGGPDYYLKKDDQRIRDIIITFVVNKLPEFGDYFFSYCGNNVLCLDYNKNFRYDLGDGERDYTLRSLSTSVLRNEIKNSNEDNLAVSLFFHDLYLKNEKNDPEVIDIGLSAIDRQLFNLEDSLFYKSDILDEREIKHLDFNVMMEFNDISHAVFSFYYMYIIEDRHDDDSFAYIARDTLKQAKTDDLTKKYKAKMLEMINSLEENQYHRLASLFLKEYFSNKKLQTPGIENNILSCYKYVLNQTAHDDLTPTKMLEMISYLEEKKCHRLASLFLKEYFSKEGLRQEVIEHNILSCYRYVLNQMEFRENVHAGAQPIAKPQVAQKDLKDIMIFLEEKKYHSIASALFSEYGPNKVLDANAVFKYDVGGCEKACTPVALSVLYTLTELAERNKVDEFGKECEDLKKYLLDNVLISKSVPILNKCIANTQGSRQQSLISLKGNINQYALGHRYCEHLYNEIMKYGMKIKLRSHKEDVLCVDIMNWMLYYQEQ